MTKLMEEYPQDVKKLNNINFMKTFNHNKEQLNYFVEVFKAGATASQEHIDLLKKTLKENGFKICGMGVELMLTSMSDMGMEEDAVTYWKTIGLTNFPYNPADALKEKGENL